MTLLPADNASPLFGLSVKIERATAVEDSLTSSRKEER
jgi:hypothetical protein